MIQTANNPQPDAKNDINRGNPNATNEIRHTLRKAKLEEISRIIIACPSHRPKPGDHNNRLAYQQQLNTSEWQKRRKRILERDDFFCRICGVDGLPQNSPTLHVHHTIYIQGYTPWEYLDQFLITLCEECHTKTHDRNEVRVYHETELFKVTGLVGDLDPTALRPCTRCLGAGIFPQWNHIQGGVCFRCRGNRYEKTTHFTHLRA